MPISIIYEECVQAVLETRRVYYECVILMLTFVLTFHRIESSRSTTTFLTGSDAKIAFVTFQLLLIAQNMAK